MVIVIAVAGFPLVEDVFDCDGAPVADRDQGASCFAGDGGAVFAGLFGGVVDEGIGRFKRGRVLRTLSSASDCKLVGKFLPLDRACPGVGAISATCLL